MENGIELLSETLGVVLFCAAVSLMLLCTRGLQRMNGEVKHSIYDHHVIYMQTEGRAHWIP